MTADAPQTTSIAPAPPSTEAIMRARAVLRNEVERIRKKAAIWRECGAPLVGLLDRDADQLESVRRHLLPMDYPSIIEAEGATNAP